MLSKVSEQVAYCLQRAKDSRDRADKITDANVKQDYLDLERRRLLLARNYELTERVGSFTGELKRRLGVLKLPEPPHPALPRVECPRCGKQVRLVLIAPSAEGELTDFVCACGFVCQMTTGRFRGDGSNDGSLSGAWKPGGRL